LCIIAKCWLFFNNLAILVSPLLNLFVVPWKQYFWCYPFFSLLGLKNFWSCIFWVFNKSSCFSHSFFKKCWLA